MSYSHYQAEKLVQLAADLTSAAVQGEFRPGYQPVIVRAVALVFTEVPGDDAFVGEFNLRPTAGSASGESQIAQIAATAAQGAPGLVRYVGGLSQKVEPGEGVSFEVIAATSTTGIADAIIFYEPAWDAPENNSNMADAS